MPGQNCQQGNFTLGRLVAVTDRAQRSVTCYDGRGRTVEVAKQLADPSGNIGGRWYHRRAAYDGADRPKKESTGASLLSEGQQSWVETRYTERGKVRQVDSSYGLLVDHVKRDADGLVEEIEYGDGASTTTAFSYDDLRRLRNVTTYRAGVEPMLLQDEELTYDASDQRVRKSFGRSHTLYVFRSYELRGAFHDGVDYTLEEVPYLFAIGVRLARVVSQAGTTWVFLELGDHLGSTSAVLDRATGKQVKRSTTHAYGEVESSLRAEEFEELREDYRFTEAIVT